MPYTPCPAFRPITRYHRAARLGLDAFVLAANAYNHETEEDTFRDLLNISFTHFNVIIENFCFHMGVSFQEVHAWIDGNSVPPPATRLKAQLYLLEKLARQQKPLPGESY